MRFSSGSSSLNSQKRQRNDRKPKRLAYSAIKFVCNNKKTKILIDRQAFMVKVYYT